MNSVFYGVKKKDFEKIHVWFITGLFNAMNYAGFSSSDITKYLDNAPRDITFNQSGSRQSIARLNKSVEAADWAVYDDGVYIDVIEQNHLSHSVNKFIIWEEKPSKNIYHPADKLKEYIDLL